MKDPRDPIAELTVLDWVGVVLVGLGCLFCALFPFLVAPAFARMFAELKSAELPDITQLGLTVWFPLMLGLNPASIVFYALSGRLTLGRRRLFLVLAFLLSMAASGVLLYAMYAPIFQLAGNIQ